MCTRPCQGQLPTPNQLRARRSIAAAQIHLLFLPRSLPQAGTMLLLRAGPTAYAKVDKVDAEEARHWKAQFLIHKLLEEERPTRRRPSAAAAFARGGACRVVARAARIGVRVKRLRLAVRSFRLRVCRSVHRHLRNIARLGSPRS